MVSAEISRSWLLVNGSHSEEFDAAAATKADQIVLDIEDAVDPSQKAQSRAAVAKWLETKQAWVRINDYTTDFWRQDLDGLKGVSGLKGVMLAKTEYGGTGVSPVADWRDASPTWDFDKVYSRSQRPAFTGLFVM